MFAAESGKGPVPFAKLAVIVGGGGDVDQQVGSRRPGVAIMLCTGSSA